MKSNDWRGIAELIGIAAIVASLVFVGLQMQQEQEIAITETRSTVTQNIGDLSLIIGAAPGVWKRGLDGEELTAEERITFLTMVEAVESHTFLNYLRFRRLEVNEPEALARNYAYALYIYPGLKQARSHEDFWLESQAAAYQQPGEFNPFLLLVREYLDKLEAEAPPKPENKRYVFW